MRNADVVAVLEASIPVAIVEAVAVGLARVIGEFDVSDAKALRSGALNCWVVPDAGGVEIENLSFNGQIVADFISGFECKMAPNHQGRRKQRSQTHESEPQGKKGGYQCPANLAVWDDCQRDFPYNQACEEQPQWHEGEEPELGRFLLKRPYCFPSHARPDRFSSV